MRVLVTGASGHVGNAIASRLLDADHQVVGLGRRLTKGNRRLHRAIAADLGEPGLADAVTASEPRCDAIVHAAASLDLSPHARSISLTNGLGTQQIVELAARWEVESLVFLSSVPVIGRPRELPITEDHPLDPPTAYHASKLYGEQLMAVARGRGIKALSLRLTSPVGPGMPAGRILSVFVRRALAGEPLEVAGDGTRGQDYVDVRDVACAVESSLSRRADGLVNVASGRCVPNLELAERCVRALGSSSEVRLAGSADPGDGVRWEVSIDAARRLLAFEPRHSLEDSIRAVGAEAGWVEPEADPEADPISAPAGASG
jgi:UDP-glucose 4-epimerase